MKNTEIKKLSLSELQSSLDKYQKEYSDLKMLHAVTPLESPTRLRTLRRTAARIATEINIKNKQ